MVKKLAPSRTQEAGIKKILIGNMSKVFFINGNRSFRPRVI